MAKVRFIFLEEVVAIHHDQIEKYGGSHGIRESELLLSALERPKASFFGDDLYPDIFNKASALMHSLILNHPFLDGNKRTGMVAGIIFLNSNGWSLDVKQGELVKAALNIASKEWSIEEISKWLKEHSVKIK